jgi:hypothetical protein
MWSSELTTGPHQQTPPQLSLQPVDLYRSINAVVETYFKTLKLNWSGAPRFRPRLRRRWIVTSTASAIPSGVTRHWSISAQFNSKDWLGSYQTAHQVSDTAGEFDVTASFAAGGLSCKTRTQSGSLHRLGSLEASSPAVS